MILKSLATVNPKTKFRGFSETPLFLSTYHPSIIFSNLSFTSLKCHCSKNEIADKPNKGFSALPSVVPWETGSLWSTLSFYMFNLHIPLGYRGMSIIAYILHQPVLDPQTQDVNSPILKEMLLSSDVAKVACVLVYCIIASHLEETVYRGFLLRSLACGMNWQQVVAISAAICSAAHFSGENFLLNPPTCK